jgi:uroporphyrinogen decarboxylase
MTSRERVLAAAQRRQADRIPVELGSTVNAGIARQAHRNLIALLEIKPEPEVDDIFVFGTVWPHSRLLELFGVDFTSIQLRGKPGSFVPIDDERFRDDFGRVWRRTALYYDIVENPLKEPTLDALERMAWPDPAHPEEIKGLCEEVAGLRAKTDKAIVARCFSGGLSDIVYSLRGMDNFLTDLFLNTVFAEALLDTAEQWFTAKCTAYMEAVGDFVDLFEYGNDYGTQRGLVMAPDLYRRHFKPRETRVFEAIKSRSRAKVFYHSCGGIYDIIGDLIDSGVDILNPLQPNAAGMMPERIVGEFGRDLSFCGGIDVQHLLPYGTPEQVRDETKRVASIYNRYGGYILAASHCIQADVPPENVLAMFTALGQTPIGEFTNHGGARLRPAKNES